tara:strand:+ start:81 stop:4316 length:4236 start_codon:yes stop_codon:yes gene_type:complete
MASSANRVTEVREEIGSGESGRETTTAGLGQFVDDIVDTYIYEYFLYEGTDQDVAERLNVFLNTYQPDWAMEKAVDAEGNPTDELTGKIRLVDTDKMPDFRVHLYSLWETNVASRLFTNLSKNFWGDGAAGKRTRVIGENLGDIFYEEANGSFPNTKGWIDGSPQPVFFGWPTPDMAETSSPSTTELSSIDWYTFVNTAANTGLFTVGAGYGDNRPTYQPARQGTKSRFIKRPITATFEAIFVNGKAPIAKYELYYTTGNLIRSRWRWLPVVAPNAEGDWVPLNATKADLYGDDYYFWLKTGRELIGTGAAVGGELESEKLSPLTSATQEVEKTHYKVPYNGFQGLAGEFVDPEDVKEEWRSSNIIYIGSDPPDARQELKYRFAGRTDSPFLPGGAGSLIRFNVEVIAAIASCYPQRIAVRMKDVLSDVFEEVLANKKHAGAVVGDPDAIRDPFTKAHVSPDVAGLKPFNEQCFLLEYIRPITKAKNAMDSEIGARRAYSRIGRIGNDHKAPGNLISFLNHGKKSKEVNALLNLCPEVYALLTPHIKIYRVDYLKDKTLVPYRETEIPFPTFIDPEDIQAITDKDYGRFPGAGIKSFSWNLDGVNPAEVENNISANLVLHFQTIQDFFSLNTSLKAGADQAGYLDLVIGSGTSFLEKPVKALKNNPEKAVASGCLEAATSKYEGERFRIKVCAGWSTPPGFENLVAAMDTSRGKNPDYGKDLKDAIDRTRISLYLQNTTHELTFNEDGSVGLNIDYQASLSGILRAPNADIFTGGTEYDQTIEKLEEQIEKKNDEIADVLKEKPDATGDDPDITRLSGQKKELLEELESLLKKEKALKYKRFLCGLYTSGKIYSLKVPREEFSLLKDLSPIQRDEAARKRVAGKMYTAGFTPQNPTNTDLDRMNDYASQLVNLTLNDSSNPDEDMASKIRDLQFSKTLDKLTSNTVDISYFYLGDFIDNILQYLSTIVTKNGTTDGSFQMLLANVELMDPLLAFQIKEVDIKCGTAANTIIKKAMADVNPLKFRGLNQIKFTTNLSTIPISLEFFQEWFVNHVVRSQREKYPFLQFIKAVCSSLIAKSFNSTCFDDALKFQLRFDTNIFNFDKSYTSKVVNVDTLAASKARADETSCQPLTKPGDVVVPSIVLYSVDSQPTSEGDYTSDLENGIYHYYLGASCGIAKKIQFQRQNMPYYREARIGRTSALSAVQLRELYNTQIDMIGNNLHRNGQYLYVNPVAIGAGSQGPVSGELPTFARLLGIGGYYLISKVSHEVSAGGFDVSVTGIQEGQDFSSDANKLVGMTTFGGEAMDIKGDPANFTATADSDESDTSGLSTEDLNEATASGDLTEDQRLEIWMRDNEAYQDMFAAAMEEVVREGQIDPATINDLTEDMVNMMAEQKLEARGIFPPAEFEYDEQ